jgi:D-xylose transport system substrate-binding protein
MSVFSKFTRRAALASVAAAVMVTSAGTAFAGDIKIGFLLKTMQEERYKRDRAAFVAKAEELGAEVIFDSANNDELTQLAKFENMLAKGADVIVLQPVNTGTAGSMVSMANSEGVRVVDVDQFFQLCANKVLFAGGCSDLCEDCE